MIDLVVSQQLLTRFNVRYNKGYEQGERPGWLEERIELFARYCAPSVANQTMEVFDWLVFFDEHTPSEVIGDIQRLDHRIRAILVPPSPKPHQFFLSRFVPTGVDVVISTRLDSDDALHRNFLQRVRDQVPRFWATDADQWICNPLFGYKLNVVPGTLHEASMPDSPFFSMFERPSARYSLKGALSVNHTHVHERFPTYQDTEEHLWVQVVHGGNVSNRVRRWERPVPVGTLEERFGFELIAPAHADEGRSKSPVER